MNIYKIIIISLVALSYQCLAKQNELYETLITPNYLIQIKNYCGDQVRCPKVSFTLIEKNTGKRQSFTGKTFNFCDDPKSTCEYVDGYIFNHQGYRYMLYEENPVLDILKNNKPYRYEKGQWAYTNQQGEIVTLKNSKTNEICWSIDNELSMQLYYTINRTLCFYPEKNLGQAYQIYRKNTYKPESPEIIEAKHLLKTINPMKNSTQTYDGSNDAILEMSYTWKNNKEFSISFQYDGDSHSTAYIFRQRSNGTVIISLYYPG